MAEIDEKTREALGMLRPTDCGFGVDSPAFDHIEQQLQDYAELLEALEWACSAKRVAYAPPSRVRAWLYERALAVGGRQEQDHDGTGPSIAAALIRAAKENR